MQAFARCAASDPDPMKKTTLPVALIQERNHGDAEANLAATIKYCTENPRWRLSLQSHKMIGIR